MERPMIIDLANSLTFMGRKNWFVDHRENWFVYYWDHWFVNHRDHWFNCDHWFVDHWHYRSYRDDRFHWHILNLGYRHYRDYWLGLWQVFLWSVSILARIAVCDSQATHHQAN